MQRYIYFVESRIFVKFKNAIWYLLQAFNPKVLILLLVNYFMKIFGQCSVYVLVVLHILVVVLVALRPVLRIQIQNLVLPVCSIKDLAVV